MRRRTLLVLFAVVACTESPSSPASTPSPATSLSSPVVSQRGTPRFVSYDQALYQFSKEHAGFGGITMTSDGSLVASFTGQPTATASEVEGFAVQVLGPPARGRRVTFEKSERSFDFLYDELQAFLAGAKDNGLTMFDIDEHRHRILLGFSDREKLNRVRSALVDKPWFVTEIAEAVPTLQGVRGFFRPLLGGTEIRTGSISDPCSFGGAASLVAFDDPAWWSAPQYALTAAHCSREWGIVGVGDEMGQPSTDDLVGVELVDPPFFTPTQDPACPQQVPWRCRYSDVSIYRLSGQGLPAWPYPVVAATPVNDPLSVAFGWTLLGMWYQPPFGMQVVKTGRTTGSTAGHIINTCQSRLANSLFGPAWFLCISVVDGAALAGDSGSPVVGGGFGVINYHAGIVFAGGASAYYFTPHGNIIGELGMNYFVHCLGLPCH
jgi:hypothetical protein